MSMILLNWITKISLSPILFAMPKGRLWQSGESLTMVKPDSDEYRVTFSYKEREHPEVKWTVPVEKFISLLIQHIPPKHFRVVRYYGALATRTKPLFKRILSKLFRRMKEMAKFTRWRERITSFTGKDPLRSSICQREMELVEVAYFSRRLDSLDFYHPP